MKKNIILTILCIVFIIILVVLLILSYNTAKNYSCSKSFLNSSLEFQKSNEEKVFSIDKITYFSSANADITTTSNSSFAISDLYQYTDIAIFINPNSDNLTPKNTLKSITLDNFEFSKKPGYGSPSLYYKNINDFATSKYDKINLIENSLSFETTSDDTIDYSKPVLYNNCANPITLCYVNSNIEDKYTLSDDVSNIAHNGSLLKNCNVTLNSISCKISFTINITNNLDEVYTCPITLNMPLSTESSTIYDGSLTIKDNTNYRFLTR